MVREPHYSTKISIHGSFLGFHLLEATCSHKPNSYAANSMGRFQDKDEVISHLSVLSTFAALRTSAVSPPNFAIDLYARRMYQKVSLLLVLASACLAQRPGNISICDYYTSALFQQNTGANQYSLVTYLVNTVVIGSYNGSHATAPDFKVPGILAPGNYNGTKVNLLPYFDGGLKSTNRGVGAGVAVNFLDGGGAKPLMINKPANADSSAQ